MTDQEQKSFYLDKIIEKNRRIWELEGALRLALDALGDAFERRRIDFFTLREEIETVLDRTKEEGEE